MIPICSVLFLTIKRPPLSGLTLNVFLRRTTEKTGSRSAESWDPASGRDIDVVSGYVISKFPQICMQPVFQRPSTPRLPQFGSCSGVEVQHKAYN